MCFLSSNISLFPRKNTFSISRSDINLMRLDWAENQPFSLDSHVALTERRKIAIQLIYCITFSCPKKHNYRKIGLTLLFIGEQKLSSSVGGKNGHFDHVPYLRIPKDFRF